MKKVMNLIKKIKNFLLLHKMAVVGVFILIALFLCCPSSNKIGIVDKKRVYAEAKVFQVIHDEQKNFEKEWKEQAIEQREKLEKADRELAKKKSRMKKAVFEKEVAALKEKILNFQNQQMAKLDLIRYQTAQITKQIEKTMNPMIEQVAKKRKLDFVLDSSKVLYYEKIVDITDEVIKRLDESFQSGQLPSAQISLSEGE